MPNWLNNLKQQAEDKVKEVSGSLVERVQEQVGGGGDGDRDGDGNNTTTSTPSFPHSFGDLQPLLGSIKEKGKACQQAAKDTVEICNATKEKRQQMIDFAGEIVKSLQSLQNAEDTSSILSTIQELTKGERVLQAQELAKGLDVAALECVEKSKTMIDLMEGSVNSLPEFVRRALEPKEPQDDLLKDLDKDLEDVQTCVTAIKELRLVTAVKAGTDAFSQLSLKAERSQTLFDKIHQFATDVTEFTAAFDTMDVKSLASHGKEMLQCLHMTKSLRLVSEGAGKLIGVLIQLFDAIADRVSALWAALGKAKDCMLESVEIIQSAKAKCTEARDQSRSLFERSGSITKQLEGLEDVNAGTINSIRELGTEIQQAVDLAQSMDDMVLDCSNQVVGMVDRVTTSFKELPPILTEGLDVVEAGKQEGDPDPVQVEENIQTLEQAQRSMEEANILEATKSGVAGFRGVSEQVSTCTKLLERMDIFSSDCDTTIASFIKAWDLEAAGKKITEMCRLVSLGELYRQFAEQIKKLIAAMVAFMKTAIDKLSNLSLGDVGASLVQGAGDALENVVGESGQDLVDGAVDMVKNKFNLFKK